MRIAISGTHRVGKSTLIDDLEELLPSYRTIAEPYYHLEEEGYEFAGEPSIEDYIEQFQYSIALLGEGEPDALFDRCPADFLGYLRVHPDSETVDLEEWLSQVRGALRTLDLIVFVGIEHHDRVVLPRSENAAFRSYVDEALRTILLEDEFNFGVEILEVHGDRKARVNQVLQRIR